MEVRDQELRIAKETPATRIAGQISTIPRTPAKAQISQNGTITEKNGSCRPIIAAELQQIEPGHGLQRDHRRAQRAVGDRRGVGDQRQARGGQRREAEADQDGAGDGDRRAETGRALEERAEAEGDEQQLQPAIVVTVGCCSVVNASALVRELVEEDDVEDDPADRKRPWGPETSKRTDEEDPVIEEGEVMMGRSDLGRKREKSEGRG